MVVRQQYFILFAAPKGCLCKGDLISNSNKADKGPLLYGSILRRSPVMQQINRQKAFLKSVTTANQVFSEEQTGEGDTSC